jgi:Planctomycete cytochrome C
MKSLYGKIVLFVLLVGLLSSCGAQPTSRPASPPADTSAPETEAPTDVPPPTEAAAPTEPPAATDAPTGAPATQAAVSEATVSFANDILPIFESRCMGCHGGERTQKGLDLKTYESLMAGSENGPVVTPGNAADSLLVELITNQKVPKRGPKLTPPQVQLITDWISQGAPEN